MWQQERIQGAICETRTPSLPLPSISSTRTLAPAADFSGRRAGAPAAVMMDDGGGGDPVEDFLIGGAGDDGEDLAAFCDGGYGHCNKELIFPLLLLLLIRVDCISFCDFFVRKFCNLEVAVAVDFFIICLRR